MQKFADQVYGGTLIGLDGAIDYTQGKLFKMKVWSPRVVDVTFKLEQPNIERVVSHTGSSSWEELVFDFSDVAEIPTTNDLVVIFDNGTNGDATNDPDNWTFYYDDISISVGDVEPNCENGLTGNTPGAEYTLIWADEFDTDGAICSENWFQQTQLIAGDSWANGELQHYTDRLDNSFVSDGNLNIVAKKESFTDQGVTKDYTSARLNSKYAFTYARVDVRAKLPIGAGTWPAIWTLGTDINEPGAYWNDIDPGNLAWPAPGEIDIMEHWGDDPGVIHGSVHTPSSSGATINTGTITIADVSTAFHVYSMIWDADKIQFLVDDEVFYVYNPEVKNADTWPFDSPQYLLLNVAMGGLGKTVDPAFTESSMVIDYVRVYQIDPELDASLSDLQVNGTTVNGFASDRYNYTVEVADIPVVTATTNNGSATAVVTDATAIPGITNVVVTSSNQEATKTYSINLVEVGTDATLSDLKVDGVTIEGFDPNTLDYTFEVPAESTTVPVITATTNSVLATAVITDAAAVPGTTEIVVTSEDASNTITYTVSFTKTGIDATLSDLRVDGTTIDGFDASVLNYSVVLPIGTTDVPVVTATTTDDMATVVVTDAAALPGTTEIVVISANTFETATYTVDFSVETVVIKEDQEIIFNDIANVSIGEEVLNLEAEATSGLPVSLSSSSDKIEIDALSVTLLNPGRVNITASQPGDDNFNAAETVDQSFCINPLKPVITADVNDNETIILTSSSDVGNQWYVNGTAIQNATSNVLETTSIGNYSVKVRVDDCTSPFSDELSLVVTSVNDLSEGVLVFPNPVENSFKLIGITEEIIDYQLFSVSGKMYQIQLTERDGAYTSDISNLSDGVYILKVKVESQTLQFRIIKD